MDGDGFHRNDSVQDQVYVQLRDLFREQGLRPDKYTDFGLSKQLEVSRTPVREALARLAGEGLIQRRADGGWVVTPIRDRDVEEILELTEVLEALLARKAAQNVNPESAERLRDCIEQMEEAAARRDVAMWRGAHNAADAVLAGLAGNSHLAGMLAQLEARWYRIRVAYDVTQMQMAKSLPEHKGILLAVAAGDAESASRLAAEHNRHLLDSVRAFVRDLLTPMLGEEL